MRESSRFIGWLSDARYGLRTLRRSPGHVLAAIACLGVGITASASVYSIVNALFSRPLPGVDSRGQFVRVLLATEQPGAMPESASTREVAHIRESPQVGAELASEATLGVTTVVDGATVRATAAFVSGNYFRLLATSAAPGRVLDDADDRPGAEPVVVVSHAFWRNRLAARSDAIGQSITIGGRPFTVVGIARERFGGIELSELGTAAGSRLQFWLPLSAAAGWPGAPDVDAPWHVMIARVTDARRAASVAAAVTSAASGIVRGTPSLARHAVTSPLGAPAETPTDVAIMLALFFFVPLTVLMIGCANVANLQLARATARAREVAIRLSLGASRASIVRLLTMEAVALAAVACLAGVAGTAAVLRAVERFVPLSPAIDGQVLLFVSVLAFAVVALTGLAPAWLSVRRTIGAGQQPGAPAGALVHSRLRRGLVALQVALSLVLLIVGALFARSLQSMYTGAPPVVRELLVVDLNLSDAGLADAARASFLQSVMTGLAADSRIRSTAAASRQPMLYQDLDSDRDRPAIARFVTSTWFDTMNLSPLVGRRPVAGDGPAAVVVNRRLADSLLAGGVRAAIDPGDLQFALGRSFRLRATRADTPQLVHIVGVVENTPVPPDHQSAAAVYFVMPAVPPPALSIVMRTAEPAAMVQDVRRALAAIAPQLPWADPVMGETAFGRSVDPIRYLAVSAGGLGLVALLLAAAGVYAVMSYAVLLRRREIGVRLALGARPADIVRMVLGQSVRLAIAGLVAGVALAVPLAHVAGFLFVGVSTFDSAALAVPIAVLTATALVAGTIPARRASRIEPVHALRDE